MTKRLFVCLVMMHTVCVPNFIGLCQSGAIMSIMLILKFSIMGAVEPSFANSDIEFSGTFTCRLIINTRRIPGAVIEWTEPVKEGNINVLKWSSKQFVLIWSQTLESEVNNQNHSVHYWEQHCCFCVQHGSNIHSLHCSSEVADMHTEHFQFLERWAPLVPGTVWLKKG